MNNNSKNCSQAQNCTQNCSKKAKNAKTGANRTEFSEEFVNDPVIKTHIPDPEGNDSIGSK